MAGIILILDPHKDYRIDSIKSIIQIYSTCWYVGVDVRMSYKLNTNTKDYALYICTTTWWFGNSLVPVAIDLGHRPLRVEYTGALASR